MARTFIMANLPTNACAQQKRVLDGLLKQPMTTNELREDLDVLAPAARIFELRERGFNIITHWEIIDTGHGKHRVAKYVLLPGRHPRSLSQAA